MPRRVSATASLAHPQPDGSTITYDKGRVNSASLDLVNKTLMLSTCICDSVGGTSQDTGSQTIEWADLTAPQKQAYKDFADVLLDLAGNNIPAGTKEDF